MKLLILIPSHSEPIYTKLTVASLIKYLTPQHDLNIHIGVHSNYSDYTTDLSLFEDLRKVAQIHLVDEIDWMAHYNDNYRYSKMHCLNLMNLLKNCQYYHFDFAVHLDNDLFIKQDFITDLVAAGDDFIFDYFENKRIVRKVETERTDTGYNGKAQFAPKVTAWNLVFSRKLFDRLLSNIEFFYPERVSERADIMKYQEWITDFESDIPIMFDTFSKLLYLCEKVWTDVEIKSLNGEFEKRIQHFFFSSFNYGVQISNNLDGVKRAEEVWNLEFSDTQKIFGKND